MSGFLELKCEIIRGGMEKYLTPMGPTKLHVHPIFEISPLGRLPLFHEIPAQGPSATSSFDAIPLSVAYSLLQQKA